MMELFSLRRSSCMVVLRLMIFSRMVNCQYQEGLPTGMKGMGFEPESIEGMLDSNMMPYNKFEKSQNFSQEGAASQNQFGYSNVDHSSEWGKGSYVEDSGSPSGFDDMSLEDAMALLDEIKQTFMSKENDTDTENDLIDGDEVGLNNKTDSVPDALDFIHRDEVGLNNETDSVPDALDIPFGTDFYEGQVASQLDPADYPKYNGPQKSPYQTGFSSQNPLLGNYAFKTQMGRNHSDGWEDWFHFDETHSPRYADSTLDEGFEWTDRQVLEYLFRQTDGETSWRSRTNWLDPIKSICTWEGVNCKTGHEDVSSIVLSSNGLNGLVPMAHLLSMKNLEIIKLDGNSIDLDGSTAGLTIQAKNFQSGLIELDVRDSGLSRLDGIFLDSAGNIRVPKIRTLRASRNNLSGPFPANVLMMSSMETLELDFNDMTGYLPTELSWLTKLQFLSIQSNNFVGPIPDAFGALKELRSLMLQNNQLTGTIPAFLDQLPELQKLDLSGQVADGQGGLSGPLLAFSNLSRLSHLDLSTNSLSGGIPSNILESVSDNTLQLAAFNNNRLTGQVPVSLGRFAPTKLFLHDNFFESYAEGLCQSNTCKSLMCDVNTFNANGRNSAGGDCTPCPSGLVAPFLGWSQCFVPDEVPIPTRDSPTDDIVETGNYPDQVDTDGEQTILTQLFQECGGESWHRRAKWLEDSNHCEWQGITCDENGFVSMIRLSSNNVKGNLPSSLFDLPMLNSLFLNGNMIIFDAANIVSAARLETLDLTATGLFSVQGLQQAPKLKSLALASNLLTGTLPESLFTMLTLEELILDYNHFQENTPLPALIGDLIQLQLFSCAECGLGGPLPVELLSLSNSLVTLRLEGNSFIGDLTVLDSMTSLVNIDVSNCEFSGNLPSFAALHDLRRLDLSFNNLSGLISPAFLLSTNKNAFELADLRANSISGEIPQELSEIIYKIDLSGNKISSIDHANCENIQVSNFGCNGVLCEPGTYNENGRQESILGACLPCPTAIYYGSSTCGDKTAEEDVGSNVSPLAGSVEGDEGVDDDASEEESSLGEEPFVLDRDILSSLFMATEGLQWKIQTNWLDSTVSICTWYGIKCADQVQETVEAIELKSNNLQGTVPSFIFDLPELKSLILDGNEISIELDNLHQAKNLKILDLSNTNVRSLEGISPDGSSDITDLHLASTKISGTFPSEIFYLPELERLTLDFNSLTGEFPTQIADLKRLTYLSAHENQFHGTLPASLGGLSNLMFLTLQNNAFTGTIPLSFQGLTNLWFLDISNQDGSGLNGPLPSFDSFAELRRLDLSMNSFTGTLPNNFLQSADVTMFEYADLSSNQLEGSIPATMSRFPIGTYFLQNNKITAIDSSVCAKSERQCNDVLCPVGTYNEESGREEQGGLCVACAESQYFGSISCGEDTSSSSSLPVDVHPSAPAGGNPAIDRDILTQFYEACGGPRWSISTNWITNSSICDWHGIRCADNSENVAYIMLSANNLVGTPPATLFDLPLLRTLVLDSNEILFSFDGIENAILLETLDISSTGLNNLQGVGKATSLTSLHITSNALVGQIPAELFELTNLERITLDFNQFSGQLPADLNLLTKLRLFSCANNALTGQLPDLTSMSELQTLRLQMNALDGTLPVPLGSISTLSTLDLADQKGNGISGPLLDFSMMPDLRRLDLSKNSLTGSVPASFLKSVSSEFFEFASLKENKLDGTVPAELGSLIERVYLEDNFITAIAPDLCDQKLGGNIAEFECDAILCPANTFNERGKQDSPYFPCTECIGNSYMGSTRCHCLEDPEAVECGGSDYLGSTNITIIDEYDMDDQDTDDFGSQSQSGLSDREILTKFYNSCGGYYWWKNDNWLDDDVSICEWYGIKCVDNKSQAVKSIHLGANNVKSEPPSELFLLPQLGSISLYSNPVVFKFDGIENAKGLTHLALDATNLLSLEGIGKAPNLVELEARFNKLGGVIPDEIMQVRTLRRLSLSHNDLEAPLPDFGTMPFLEELLLASNNFNANLGSVQLPPTIKMLDLSDNSFSGIIPPDFLSNVPETTDLIVDLSNNKLTGNVPSSLARFDELTLKLRDNQLSAIDNELCQKSKWNGGDVGRYSCDGILCPAGKSASNGRQNSDQDRCIPCNKANFLGGTACSTDREYSSGFTKHKKRSCMYALFLSLLFGMWA